jgi:uncharacterized protein YxeA
MLSRVFSFLIVLVFCVSCNELAFTKKNKTNALIDTLLDFSSVDVSPSFKICDSIIDKSKKTDCFRTTIHQKIGEELAQYSFTIKDSISEIVWIDLRINSKGVIAIDEIESPVKIKKELPELDSLLDVSIKKLPIIFPALKRGTPVTTQYRLPIKIQLKE